MVQIGTHGICRICRSEVFYKQVIQHLSDDRVLYMLHFVMYSCNHAFMIEIAVLMSVPQLANREFIHHHILKLLQRLKLTHSAKILNTFFVNLF